MTENIWFDGVDKRLIETHAVKKTLVEGNDSSLITKVPLDTLSSFEKTDRKEQKRHPQTNVKHCSNATTAGDETKNSKSDSMTKTNNSNGGLPKNRKNCIEPSAAITDELAIDCEMVECFHHKSVLARVSIVNLFGHPIYDCYVAPPAQVTDYRTKYSGIRKKDLENAPDFDEVKKDVENLIKNRIVVGHALHNDFRVLQLNHPPHLVRDTSHYFKKLFQGKTPSLKKLSESVLGIKIQKGEHDSIQDAQATMKLYVKEREQWNTEIVKKASSSSRGQSNISGKRKKTIKQKPKKKKMKTFYVLT